MLNNKKITVVLPAYNAALTLEKTYNELPFDIVDSVILVDDASKDNTVELGEKLAYNILSGMIKIKGTAPTKNPATPGHWKPGRIL